MTNEEFQKAVLDKLGSIDKEIQAISNQTAILTEFKTEVNEKLGTLLEDNKSMYEVIGEHEISIRSLRRKPV